ncbi:DMT family transporter [Lysinimonas soli]|uniref:DMT family transporter n=1 Tax=Lysinimonas soli TaxID=1074233 RepID=A0ABW0NP30_9MICO
MDDRSTGGILALLLASLLWGTTGTAAAFLPHDVSSLAVGACTMGVGGLLLLATSPRMSTRVLRDGVGRRWAALGAIGVVVYPLAFYSAMSLAGVAVGNVVALGSGPVFAALFEWLGERHPLSRRWTVATGLAVLGIVGLAFGRAAGPSTPTTGTLPGVALGLLAGAAYAWYTYASSRAIRSPQPSRGVMGAMFGIGAVLLLPVLFVTGAPLLQSSASLGIAAYLALGPMFLAYLLFGVGLRTVRSSAATTVTLLEPVVATILAVVVVGERLTAVGWTGLALVFAGLVVLITARRGSQIAERL